MKFDLILYKKNTYICKYKKKSPFTDVSLSRMAVQ